MAGLDKLIAWWRSLPLPWRPWRVIGQVAMGDEVPSRLPYKGVVLVGKPGSETWAALDCPCQRGHRLMVNLDRSRKPVWSVDSLKPLTLRPSIDDIRHERRCHFYMRNGKVKWAHRDDWRAEQ